MVAVDPSSISLARASWNAATPGTRTMIFLRSKYSIPGAELNKIDLASVPFLDWDELDPQTALAMAWDFQFMARVLRDGQGTLRASTGLSVVSARVAK